MTGLSASRYGNAYNGFSTQSPQDPAPNSHNDAGFHDTSAAIHDLGRERFDQDVAAVGDRDFALLKNRGQPVTVARGQAPKGLEAQVFAWNAMQYTTEDRDEKEEAKGDLHGGQLHRQNRAAREPQPGAFGRPQGFGGHGGRGGFGANGGSGGRGRYGGHGGGAFQMEKEGFLRSAHRFDDEDWPLCKGYAAELNEHLFWNEPIVPAKEASKN